MSRFILVPTLALGLFLSPASAQEKARGYTFTMNGQPVTPRFIHLDGTTQQPAPGDLINIDGLWMTLGTEKKQAFQAMDRKEGILWMEKASGGRQAVAVFVRWTFTDEKDDKGQYQKISFNPFQKLSPEDIRQLRAVILDDWTDDLPKSLAQLDPARVCITLHGDAAVGKERSVPPLPRQLRALIVAENNNMRGLQDYKPLAELKDLRYLQLRSMTASFDCSHLKDLQKLSDVALTARGLRNTDALGDVAALRHLNLSYNRDLRDITFAARLSKLETLKVSHGAVRDLSSLAGHPALQHVEAYQTPLQKLPLDKPMPALRTLEALSTSVSDADAAAFAKLNPQCKVSVRWNQALANALDGVDRIRVRTGGTCHRDIPREHTLYEEKDAAQVRALVQQIKIEESDDLRYCMCCGEPSLEFYKNGKLVLTLGYHHGDSLRWREGWPSDGEMTQECAAYLRKWLADHIPEIKRGQELELAARKRDNEEKQKFLSHFPEKVRPMIMGDGGLPDDEGQLKQRQRIVAAFADENALAIAVCRALGTLEGYASSWSGTTNKERGALTAVANLNGAAYLHALNTLQDDKRALLGAARLFFWEGMGQRLSPEERDRWTVRLAEVSLQEGYDGNKSLVMRHLSRCRDEGTRALLHDIMLGRKGAALKEPDEDEPGLQAHAALALVQRKEPNLKPQVEKLLGQAKEKSDIAAYQVALALLGDHTQLRGEHFQLRSGTIGYAAIQAIEQFQGVHGLDILVEHGLNHLWGNVNAEAKRAVERLTGQKWPENERKAVIAWWKANGAAFVEQRRKERQAKP